MRKTLVLLISILLLFGCSTNKTSNTEQNQDEPTIEVPKVKNISLENPDYKEFLALEDTIDSLSFISSTHLQGNDSSDSVVDVLSETTGKYIKGKECSNQGTSLITQISSTSGKEETRSPIFSYSYIDGNKVISYNLSEYGDLQGTDTWYVNESDFESEDSLFSVSQLFPIIYNYELEEHDNTLVFSGSFIPDDDFSYQIPCVVKLNKSDKTPISISYDFSGLSDNSFYSAFGIFKTEYKNIVFNNTSAVDIHVDIQKAKENPNYLTEIKKEDSSSDITSDLPSMDVLENSKDPLFQNEVFTLNLDKSEWLDESTDDVYDFTRYFSIDGNLCATYITISEVEPENFAESTPGVMMEMMKSEFTYTSEDDSEFIWLETPEGMDSMEVFSNVFTDFSRIVTFVSKGEKYYLVDISSMASEDDSVDQENLRKATKLVFEHMKLK